MRGKLIAVIISSLLFMGGSSTAVFAITGDNTASSAIVQDEKKISLTDAQKKELKQLFDKKFDVEKQLVQKYVDFGVLTREQADRRLKKIQDMQDKLEENGYAPWHGKGSGGHLKDKERKPQNPTDQQTE